MELTKQVKIILDSQDYKYLFEPSSKIEWLSSEVEALANGGLEFYHSAACSPYYVLMVNSEDLKDLLKALYDHIVLSLSAEIVADLGKYSKDYKDEEEWEINHHINQVWSVDSYDELCLVKQSINKLEGEVYRQLCLARKGLI